MGNSTSKNAWVNTDLYPFESQHLALEAGKMHYIDEGKGDVMLFVHGTPAWSFLYRDFIKEFSNTHRCIAIDHLGFGLSDKPQNFAGRPEDHSQNLSEFVQKMNLDNITLVVHDFGGPIGLSFAIAHPEKVKQVVMFNTWLWATNTEKDALKVDRILHSTLGKFLYLNSNFSPKVLFKQAFHNKKKLDKTVHKQYTQPFPDKASRQGLLKIGQALVGSSNWYAHQWQQIDKISHKPFLVLWGAKDKFIRPAYLERWKEKLSNAQTVTYECGHFVQEEETQASIIEMRRFIKKNAFVGKA